MKRIVLGVEYDGMDFCGWQSQAGACGVQDALEKAIASVAGTVIRTHAAGRTDTGVHATIQVVHFDTEVNRSDTAWVRGVNAFLPESIRVLWSKVLENHEAGLDFHARFSATSRHYQYWLVNAPVATAIMAKKAGWYHLPLSIEPMQQACKCLLGEHDFSAFRASECQAKSPVKTMHEASVTAHGQNIIFNFSANAFLHHQVRNMVGALIYVGNGKLPPEHIKTLLQHKDRTQSPPTFSPYGLYLVGVGYDERWGLPFSYRPIQSITTF